MKNFTNTYITSEERERWEHCAWFELCFYDIDDEFNTKRKRNKILEFIREQTDILQTNGIEVDLQEEEGVIVVQARTIYDSDAARDALSGFLGALQSRYLFTIRDYYVDKQVTEHWGENFSVPFLTPTPDTSSGRRVILQTAMNTRFRASGQIKKLTNVQQQLQETKAKKEISEQIINIQLQQLDSIIEILQRLLAESTVKIRENVHLINVAAATEISVVPTSHFLAPLTGNVSPEFNWHTADDPKEINPSVCSTVNDILTHPLLWAALRRVVHAHKEDYETELIHVLRDPQKTDALLEAVKKVLRRAAPIELGQLKRGILGIIALVQYVQEHEFAKFSEDLKKQELKEISLTDLPLEASEKLLESIHLLISSERSITADSLVKKFIANTSTTPSRLFPGKRMDGAIVKEITPHSVISGLYTVSFCSGATGYYIFNEGQHVPATFQEHKIIKIEDIPNTPYFRIFTDKKNVICQEDLSPLKFNDQLVVDYFVVENYDLEDGKQFYKTEKGEWYDFEGRRINDVSETLVGTIKVLQFRCDDTSKHLVEERTLRPLFIEGKRKVVSLQEFDPIIKEIQVAELEGGVSIFVNTSKYESGSILETIKTKEGEELYHGACSFVLGYPNFFGHLLVPVFLNTNREVIFFVNRKDFDPQTSLAQIFCIDRERVTHIDEEHHAQHPSLRKVILEKSGSIFVDEKTGEPKRIEEERIIGIPEHNPEVPFNYLTLENSGNTLIDAKLNVIRANGKKLSGIDESWMGKECEIFHNDLFVRATLYRFITEIGQHILAVRTTKGKNIEIISTKDGILSVYPANYVNFGQNVFSGAYVKVDGEKKTIISPILKFK